MITIFDTLREQILNKVTFVWNQSQIDKKNRYLQCYYYKGKIQYRITIERPNGPYILIENLDLLDDVQEIVTEFVNNCEE